MMDAAEWILASLKAEGVDHVFGLPGGYIYPFLKTLRAGSIDGLSLVMSRHEEGAAFMADGYARVSGKIGAAFVTAGPGATNALTAVACAQQDRVPLLLISGSTSTATLGLGAWQDSSNDGINTTEIYRHATGMSEFVVNPANFPYQFRKALKVLGKLPSEAVHLCLPLDVSSAQLATSRPFAETEAPIVSAPSSKVKAVYDALVKAERPVFYFGAGAMGLRDDVHLNAALMDFLHQQAIPYVTSPKAKGLLFESHGLSFGVFGLSGNKWADALMALYRPDLLVVLGSSLNEWASGRWSDLLKGPSLIQVDIDSKNMGKSLETTLEVQAEASAFVRQLLALAHEQNQRDGVKIKGRGEALIAIKEEAPRYADGDAMHSNATPIKPQRLMREIAAFAGKRRVNFFLDMGNCTGFFNHYVELNPPNRVFAPYGFSSMGWANAAVIGGKVAAPDVVSMALTGDGAFLMNGVEIQAAARHRIGAVYVILYDDYYGTVHHGEMSVMKDTSKMDDPYYALGAPDLVKMAEALGARSVWVSDPGALAAELENAALMADQEQRPQVLVVKVDHREKAPFGGRYHLMGS